MELTCTCGASKTLWRKQQRAYCEKCLFQQLGNPPCINFWDHGYIPAIQKPDGSPYGRRIPLHLLLKWRGQPVNTNINPLWHD